MTRDKDFKRRVRETAARTGRSYASARNALLAKTEQARGKDSISLKVISKPELGLHFGVPEGWEEFPPVLSNSPYEVTRFARQDHAAHMCVVFRMPGSDGLDPKGMAERAQAKQKAKGFDNFRLTRVEVGERPGVLLSFDKKTDRGAWTAREYFVSVGSLVYCLGLGTGDADGDELTFDAMAEHFVITDRP